MADDSYYEPALRRGSALFGEEYCRYVFEELKAADPEFSQLFQRYVYGGMYDRDVLDQKTRELLAVAACTLQNALPQFDVHVKAALRVGATKEEVQEAILQMSVYGGFPYMLQALRRFRQLLVDWKPEMGVRPPTREAPSTREA
jgi:4-carboxymuconolactone decarboxylase